MRYYILLTVLLFTTGCKAPIENHKFKMLEGELNPTQIEALCLLQEAFEGFLEETYESNGPQMPMYQFLDQVTSDALNGSFKNDKSIEALTKMEASGLRKEVYLYANEAYESKYAAYFQNKKEELEKLNVVAADTGEIQNVVEDLIEVPTSYPSTVAEYESAQSNKGFLAFNNQGAYLYALDQWGTTEPSTAEYVETRIMAGELSLHLIRSGILSKAHLPDDNPELTNLIVLMDVYYPILLFQTNGRD